MTRTPALFARRFQLDERLKPWLAVALAALLLWLPESFERWGWRVQTLGILYWQVDCAVVWLCCTRLDPWLLARGVQSRVARLLIGALAIEAATSIVYVIDCSVAFPAVIGFKMGLVSYCQWWIHVTTVALLVYGWHVMYRASAASDGELRRATLEMDELAATLANAEMALLEAQIEPHFLFNTLAHVKRDLRHSPKTADEMLDALIVYLERAAPALRREDWTIADELDLVAIYLSILQQRFGERLRFSIDSAEPWSSLKLPALAVATLVENAVKHGLGPQASGGTVRIHVGADIDAPADAGAPGKAGEQQAVRITVVDDGVGLRQTQGSGLGLATVRARLRSAFGARAVLTLEPRSLVEGLSGVRASIRIARHA